MYGLCQNQTHELTFSAVKKRATVLGCLMLFAAASSTAVSLGRHRGAALIGRPLDISVQAVLDAQEDPASLCIDADVFYADNKLDKSRVRVSAEKTSPATQDAVIRIRSSVPVDEPVVTLYVRVGCQQKIERRYVMLADPVSDVASLPVLPQAAGAAGRVPGPTATTATPASPAAAVANDGLQSQQIADPAPAKPARRTKARTAATAPAQAEPGSASSAATPEVKQTTRRKGQAAKDTRAAEKGSARLKLEPLDLTIDRDPQLRPSAELLSVPASSPQERSAAAALWRALTAQPQDILRDAEKLQSLENSVRSLQVQTQKNRQSIEGLDGQLKQAQSERYANALVYTLVALLLLAVAALAYLLRRGTWTRNSGVDDLPWWRKNGPDEKGWANSAIGAGIFAAPGGDEVSEKSRKKAKKSKGTALDLDLDLDVSLEESGFSVAGPVSRPPLDSLPPLSRRDRSDFALSMTNPARAAKAEELFDVQQQADFFVSLGQHEQAIEVLRSHIDDNDQTSALVYLDLFNLYHQLKRRADYEALRENFNQHFNAKIPAFDFYSDASSGLESYQGALTRIEALWPSPKVLEVIEESIFRRPDTSAEAFDVEAYRELLLLYAVAREIINPGAGPDAGMMKFDLPESAYAQDRTVKFASTSIQPLSASVVEDRPSESLESPPLLESVLPPAASPGLNLDLDLSQIAGESEDPPTSTTDSDFNFFAQFAADIPVDPPASAKAQPEVQAPAAGIGNLIDFESFDSPVKEANQPKRSPKA